MASLAPAAKLTPASRISTAGMGPVKIGMTKERAERAGRTRLRWQGPSLHGCRYLRPRNRFIRASFMTIRGRIVRVDAWNRATATVSGLRVGDPEDRVRQVFAGMLHVTPHEYVRGGWYMEVVPRDEPNRRAVFETKDGTVSYIRAGRLPEVRYIEGCA